MLTESYNTTSQSIAIVDNQFKIISQLGQGGSSQVFSAVDNEGTVHAIKIIRKDRNYSDDRAEHFILRENIVINRLGPHPNIIKSIECSTDGALIYNDSSLPIIYNVLEYCPNGTLSNFIKRTGPVEERIAKFYFWQLASAVFHLHSQGFAHLDIKLDNILLDEFFNLKLADLGASRCVLATKGYTDIKIGTPNYIAPEIEDKETESFHALKADIYSLGICLHLLLTGEFPNKNKFDETTNMCESESTSSDISSVHEFDNNKVYDENTNQIMPNEVYDLIDKMLDLDFEKTIGHYRRNDASMDAKLWHWRNAKWSLSGVQCP